MIQLYDLAVPTFVQTARALAGVLRKSEAHFVASGVNPDEVVNARLTDDMAPFHFQIEAMKNHAVWGLEAAKTGAFAPPPLVGAVSFAELRTMVDQAVAALESFNRDEVNSWSGKDLDIDLFRPLNEENASKSKWVSKRFALTSDTFLLTYSLPNFYFHTVTAYNILRIRGVPIGKGDYEGRLRIRS